MTDHALDAIAKAYGGSYLEAANAEADIADQFEGLGDPDTDALALRHRRISRALLARACAITQRRIVTC